MSIAEMKIAVINKITKEDDEDLLKEVLALLKEKDRSKSKPFNLSSTYEEVKEQYGEVLQKLAQ